MNPTDDEMNQMLNTITNAAGLPSDLLLGNPPDAVVFSSTWGQQYNKMAAKCATDQEYRKEDQILIELEHISVMVRFVAYSHYVQFDAWECYVQPDGRPLFQGESGGHVFDSPGAAPPLVSGSVKWDGCSNYDFPASEDCMMHGCSRDDLLSLGEMLAAIWDACMVRCPNAIGGDE